MLPVITNERTMFSMAMDNRLFGAGFGLALNCLLSLAALRCEAQGNLVPNPSFELQDTCPFVQGFQDGSKPLYWEKWQWSPDYFSTCVVGAGQDSLFGVPLNGFGFQYPADGEAYVGVAAYDPWFEYREYVGCELLEPLEVGQTYELSFFTNPALGGTYWAPLWACNNMGMLFTMEPNIWSGNNGPHFALPNYAHLHSTAVISDTASWTMVSGSFVADSAYRYLVMGNFFSRAFTDTIHLLPGPSLGAYYFVDGVCVTKSGQECTFTIGMAEPVGDGPIAWPNPTREQLHVRTQTGTRWQMHDVTGRLIRAGVSSGDLLNLDVRDEAPGEYLLRLQGKDRRYVRFVLMR